MTSPWHPDGSECRFITPSPPDLDQRCLVCGHTYRERVLADKGIAA